MNPPHKSLEDIQQENHREFAKGDKVWWLAASKSGEFRQSAEVVENLGSIWGLGVAYKIRVISSYKGFDNIYHVTTWEHPKPVGFRDLQPRLDVEAIIDQMKNEEPTILRCGGIDDLK